MKDEEQKKKQSQYISKWMSKNTFAVQIRINRNTEQDLVKFMETVPNKNEFIKGLIRKEMAENKNEKL